MAAKVEGICEIMQEPGFAEKVQDSLFTRYGGTTLADIFWGLYISYPDKLIRTGDFLDLT